MRTAAMLLGAVLACPPLSARGAAAQARTWTQAEVLAAAVEATRHPGDTGPPAEVRVEAPELVELVMLEMRGRLRADFDPKPIARPGTVREIAAAVCRAMGPRCR